MTKILIIEDEPFIRENLEDILTLEGFDILAAADGVAGLKLAQTTLPDLIICDVMMPHSDGYSVLQALKETPTTESIPFIFLTAKADRASLRQGMILGADDYLTKPFTPQEVISAVQVRLKKQAAQAQAYQDRIHALSNELEFHRAHDPLTHLPNRLALVQAFQTLVEIAQSEQSHFALLHLTFDQLAPIRAALGPDLSANLVQEIGQRLATVPQVEGMAYLSDHQFSVMMKPVSLLSQAQANSEGIVDAFTAPVMLSPHTLFLTPKIGAAFYPQDGSTLDTLLFAAEMATTGLSDQDRQPINFYSADLHQQLKHRFALEADLHYALDQKQIQVYYQPQFDIKTNQLVGSEALMRWFHPVRGSISPSSFIPIAEATELIVPMGKWVLYTASKQVHQWSRYPANGHVSVNLSPRQFVAPNLVQTVMQSLEQTELSPYQLELEITETVLMQDASLAQHILTQFREAGIRIAIDDFGVGYSSFNYLRKFALSTLKIDRCFVKNLATHSKNQKIVAAIIQMAHDLGLKVVAEGIEHQDELDCLRSLNCDLGQGYWYSQPIASAVFEQRYLSPSSMSPSQVLER